MNTLAIIGTVLGAVVTALAMVIVARLQSRSTPFGDMAKALSDERARGDRQDERLDELTESLRQATRRIDSMDADMTILINDLSAQQEWQVGGAPPPPPAISPRALDLLKVHQRIRRDATA